MGTADHADQRPGRFVLWLVILAALGVAAGLVVVVRAIVTSDPPSLQDQLAVRAVEVLEQAPPSSGDAGHHTGHGQPADHTRRVDRDGNELRCAAKTFGYDPPDATRVDEVREIYAHHMCAAIGPGLAWPSSIRETGPVTVRLADPAAVVVPEQALPGEQGAQYADRVRAIIPERYHEQALAFGNFVDPDVAAGLRDRIES